MKTNIEKQLALAKSLGLVPAPDEESIVVHLLEDDRVASAIDGRLAAEELQNLKLELIDRPAALGAFERLMDSTAWMRTRTGRKSLELGKAQLKERIAEVFDKTPVSHEPKHEVSFLDMLSEEFQKLLNHLLPQLRSGFAHSGRGRGKTLPRVSVGDFNLMLTVGTSGDMHILLEGPDSLVGRTVVVRVGELSKRKRVPKAPAGIACVEFTLTAAECRGIGNKPKGSVALASTDKRR